MNTLNTIQKLSRIGRVLSKNAFVFSVIGICGCIAGLFSLCFGNGSLIKIGGVTLHGLVSEEYGYNIKSISAARSGWMVVRAGEAVLAKFAEVYFKNELSVGTPFTLAGARELLRLGILTLAIPTGCAVAGSIVEGILAGFMKVEQAAADDRYLAAASKSTAIFSWKKKTADNLFLAIHGNTQNGNVARADWEPIVGTWGLWQLETVQSAEPDGYGTYRWSYDSTSYLPVENSLERVQTQGYQNIACGGFSAGCDMLLRAVTCSPARCDLLLLQSPWIPILRDPAEDVVRAISQKNIELRIFCGAEDEDCLPMAKQLYAVTKQAGCNVTLTVQENTQHQFPAQMDGCPPLGQIAGNSPSVLDNLKQLKQNNTPTMTVNHAEYTVIKLLGKGKGGYSYLVTDGAAQYVLKQIHHEPCEYYTFGDKLQSELRDYETLRDLGIPMPRLLAVDAQQERILKEFIAGQTVAELLKAGRMEPDWPKQVQAMCGLLYPAGLNIDYYPTNFVPHDGTLYFIDYECNAYMEEWDFEHWGAQYWTAQAPKKTEGLRG